MKAIFHFKERKKLNFFLWYNKALFTLAFYCSPYYDFAVFGKYILNSARNKQLFYEILQVFLRINLFHLFLLLSTGYI
jgi:hypothetical protein